MNIFGTTTREMRATQTTRDMRPMRLRQMQCQEGDAPCAVCGGARVVVEDTFVNGRERHEEVPCEECAGDEGTAP